MPAIFAQALSARTRRREFRLRLANNSAADDDDDDDGDNFARRREPATFDTLYYCHFADDLFHYDLRRFRLARARKR